MSLSLSDHLQLESIVFLDKEPKKDAALQSVLAALEGHPAVQDLPLLSKDILNRENLLSTGLSLGIGIPHARTAAVTAVTIALGLSHVPVKGYECLDGSKVQIIFLIAVPSEEHELYLRLLASVTLFLKNPKRRAALLNCKDRAEVLRLLRQHA